MFGKKSKKEKKPVTIGQKNTAIGQNKSTYKKKRTKKSNDEVLKHCANAIIA